MNEEFKRFQKLIKESQWDLDDIILNLLPKMRKELNEMKADLEWDDDEELRDIINKAEVELRKLEKDIVPQMKYNLDEMMRIQREEFADEFREAFYEQEYNQPAPMCCDYDEQLCDNFNATACWMLNTERGYCPLMFGMKVKKDP